MQLAPFHLQFPIEAGVTVGYVLSEDQAFAMRVRGLSRFETLDYGVIKAAS